MSTCEKIGPVTVANDDQAVPSQRNQSKRRLSLDDRALSENLSFKYAKPSPENSLMTIDSQIRTIHRPSHPDQAIKSKIPTPRFGSLGYTFIHQSFYGVYGRLGIVMLLAFALSFVTMAIEAVVQVIPNWTANFLMGTANLDNGEFLMISKPSKPIVVASAFMFAVFACLYLWLIVFMFSYNNKLTVDNLSQAPSSNSLLARIVERFLPILTSKRVHDGNYELRGSKSLKDLASKLQKSQSLAANKLIHNFMDTTGAYYRYYSAMLDFPKLIFQTMSLETYLNKGYRVPILIFYAVPLAMNWFVSFYRFQRTTPDPKVLLGRSVALFDLFFSVFSNIIMLAYAYENFSMDRAAFATREETLTPGSFDRIARVFVDPVEMDLLKSSFANLQITEGHYIFVKCFLNLLGIYKWRKLIKHLILVERSQHEHKNAESVELVRSTSRKHFTIGGLIFISCSLGIAVYTALSVSTSTNNCAPYPNCVVYSHQWRWGQSSACQCIVFIDRNLSPLTYDEWIDAPDVTEPLSELASNGHLQTVQIINRALPELSEELRLCKGLRDLILVYTKTRRFPAWMKEFSSLEYFHVENDFQHSSLEHLPLDMFSGMPNLRFIRTGGASGLVEYPSLNGLHSLSTLVLSIVRGLKELPSLDGLSGLTTLYIADAIHVPRLPSLTDLTSLKTFAVLRRNEMCCNGWATGYCDLSNFQCQQRPSEPAVKCLSDRIPDEDLAVVERVNGFLCETNITQDVEDSEPSRESTDAVCQGVMYKACDINGARGICYNGRMQVVHCDVFGEYEKMRRLQIARKVGDICDPEVETWLGC